jgi:hypothetical protein
MARNTNPSRVAVAIVRARSGGVCEICGARRANQIHHRRPRGMGGSRRVSTNRAANLLDVDDGCHERIERNREWAREHGYLVAQQQDPDAVPVNLWGRWVLLDDSGGMREPEPAA